MFLINASHSYCSLSAYLMCLSVVILLVEMYLCVCIYFCRE